MNEPENPNELLAAWDDLADQFELFARLFLGDIPAEESKPEPVKATPFEEIPPALTPKAKPIAPKPKTTIRVAIIVGHEPTKPGAVNQAARMSEFTLNSALAGQLVDLLAKRSAWIKPEIVYRAPEGYSKLPGKVNAGNFHFAISLHCNAYNQKATGTEVLYYGTSAKSKELARTLQANLMLALGLADRGIKARETEDRGGYLLRYTSMPCVIAEPFFIDNDSDLKRASDRWPELVGAYADTIEQYARTVAV